MKKIRLTGSAAGPKGSWNVGDTMTVGRDITEEEAGYLVATQQATWDGPPVLREEVVETAEAAPAPETTAKATRKPRRRKAKK